MDALGRLINVVPTADGVEVNMRDYQAVTFVCVGADTYTVQEATDAAGGGATNLVVLDRHYTNAGAVGATAWVEVLNDPALAAIVVAANAVLHVDASQLSAGFKFVRCSSTAAGLVIAILHDLKVQRRPDLLAAPAL